MITHETDLPTAAKLTGKEKRLRPLYYHNHPVANLRLSQAYDRGVRAAARIVAMLLLWVLVLVSLVVLGARKAHGQNSVPPFNTAGINSTLYVGQGGYSTIQSAVSKACSATSGMRVVLSVGSNPTDSIAAVTGCAAVSIEDQRTYPTSSFGWSGTAYTVRSVTQPIINGVQTSYDITKGTLNGASPLGSLTAFNIYTAFGDSITCGFVNAGHVPPFQIGEDCPVANAYPSIIANRTGATLHNYAIPADMSCDVWPRQIGPQAVVSSLAAPQLFSIMIGTNDANGKGTGTYEQNFRNCYGAVLSYLGIPAENKTMAGAVTPASGWGSQTNELGPLLFTVTANAVQTFPVTTFGGGIFLWYAINDAPSYSGMLAYALDSGPFTTLSTTTPIPMATPNGTSNSVGYVYLPPPIAAGAHTVSVKMASGAAIAVLGVGTAPLNQYFQHPVVVASDPPLVPGVSAANVAVYTADAVAAIRTMQATGLDIRYISNHTYMLGAAAEVQSDNVHPTPLGALHYAQAFLQAMQTTLLPAGGIPANTPTAMAGSAAGAGASVLIPASSAYTGTNRDFVLTLTTGPSGLSTGQLFVITLTGTAGYKPGVIGRCILWPYSSNATGLPLYTQQTAATTTTNATSTTSINTTLAPNVSYAWNGSCNY